MYTSFCYLPRKICSGSSIPNSYSGLFVAVRMVVCIFGHIAFLQVLARLRRWKWLLSFWTIPLYGIIRIPSTAFPWLVMQMGVLQALLLHRTIAASMYIVWETDDMLCYFYTNQMTTGYFLVDIHENREVCSLHE